MAEAGEIARLRLILALVSSVQSVNELEPLPNIDFNILAGNSLIGLLHVDEAAYDRLNPQKHLFRKTYPEIISERLRHLSNYRDVSNRNIDDLRALKDNLEKGRQEAVITLNQILTEEFGQLGIKYEEATWDSAKAKECKPKKRAVTTADVTALEPFHWGFEFSEVMKAGGFDAIITNPPWDIFKPQDKEFFAEYSDIVSKNKMTIKEFEQVLGVLLGNRENKWKIAEYFK